MTKFVSLEVLLVSIFLLVACGHAVSQLRKPRNPASPALQLMELREANAFMGGIKIARNAFAKRCNEKCIDDVIANGDKHLGNPIAIVRDSLRQVNEGGIFKVLYSYLAKTFFYAKHIVLHNYHFDELLRDRYQILRESDVFEKLEKVPRKQAFSAFISKKRKASIFELTLEPVLKRVVERINIFCGFLPDIGMSLGVTVNINLSGTCKFAVSELIRKFSVKVASWVSELFARHERLAFLENLFFSPISDLNRHFMELVGKNIIAQEKKISKTLKDVITENSKSGAVKKRLSEEFRAVDEAFIVGETAEDLTLEELLTKLDRIVLKATLLFDSDYVDELSSGWIKERIHKWAKREILEVTGPLAETFIGELREKRKRMKEEDTMQVHMWSTTLSDLNTTKSFTISAEHRDDKFKPKYTKAFPRIIDSAGISKKREERRRREEREIGKAVGTLIGTRMGEKSRSVEGQHDL